LDDQTIAQPWYASMINTLDDTGAPTAYSNGNAFAIRLKMGDQMGVSEVETTAFSIYPNPAKETVELVCSENLENAEISITDLSGKTVYSEETVSGVNIKLNVAHLENGLYIINVTNTNVSTSKRLIICK